MKALDLARPYETLSVLCLGAHADDIEIGAGGTILGWITSGVRLEVHWCVLSAIGPRGRSRGVGWSIPGRRGEERDRARGLSRWLLSLPGRGDQGVAGRPAHARGSRCDLDPSARRRAPGSSRDLSAYLEPVPGPSHSRVRDPQMGRRSDQPNLYVPLTGDVLERKIELLLDHFPSQRSKDWFDRETFRDWRACAAWSAARPSATPRPSSCARPSWGS